MIERQAITHIPLSQYAFTNSETSMTIRIRTAKDNLLACTLWYGDRVYPKDPILFTPLSMEKVASDLYFDYYEVTFESPYTRVCYYFELEDQEESTYLYADIFSKKLPKERSEFYQYPFMRREEISTVPEWLKHAVVYNIFPDSLLPDIVPSPHPAMKPPGNGGFHYTADWAEPFPVLQKTWITLHSSASTVST